MGKLHELVAAEKDVRSTVAKIIEETHGTFTKKAHLFSTHAKEWEPLKADDVERPEEEKPTPITTVGDKLGYFQKHLAKLFDVILQKEMANTQAVADIVVLNDETQVVLAEAVPVAALVQMENVLELIRGKVYDTIPTLDPAKDWSPDEQRGSGYYKTGQTRRQGTRKVSRPLVLHPGNDKHPPQVQLVNEDVVVGTWNQTYFSGLISPAEKSTLLERMDMLIEAIKKARSRANEQVVPSNRISQRLFRYINKGE